MSEVDCKTYSVFETHPRATPKPSLTSRDHLHGRRGRAAARWAHAVAPPCTKGVCPRSCRVLASAYPLSVLHLWFGDQPNREWRYHPRILKGSLTGLILS